MKMWITQNKKFFNLTLSFLMGITFMSSQNSFGFDPDEAEHDREEYKKEIAEIPAVYFLNYNVKVSDALLEGADELISKIYEENPKSFNGICFNGSKVVSCRDIVSEKKKYCRLVPDLASKEVLSRYNLVFEFLNSNEYITKGTRTGMTNANGDAILTVFLKANISKRNCF